MIRETLYTACFFGLLFIAYKLGQARELVRALDERDRELCARRPVDGARETSPDLASRSSSVFDQNGEAANGLYMTLLARTVDAE